MKNKFLLLGLMLSAISSADGADFSTGPVFTNYGPNAVVAGSPPLLKEQKFKVAFDVFKKNETDTVLRGFNSVARFINMHVRAGVPLDNIEVALVVHGGASFDLIKAKAYLARFDKTNPSADLVQKMLEKNVNIFLCGQSASHHGIANNDLIAGVEMSLSAMTAHALLQQDGYTLNPF